MQINFDKQIPFFKDKLNLILQLFFKIEIFKTIDTEPARENLALERLEELIKYLENDLESHVYVNGAVAKWEESGKGEKLNNGELKGGQCFGMGLLAFSVMDLFGYLYVGIDDLSKGTPTTRFHKKLFESKYYRARFAGTKPYLFTMAIRHGMVHQVYPRNMYLDAKLEATTLLSTDSKGRQIIDTYYLLRNAIDGLKEFRDDIRDNKIDENEILRYNSRMKKIMDYDSAKLQEIRKNKKN